jgi:hypothetical protein
MNRSAVRTRHTRNGWIAEYKLCWKADYEPVLRILPDGRKDGPIYYDTQDQAEVAAWRCKDSLEQPVMTRDGAILEARREAERVFSKRGAGR